jgi:hypothetical protein
MMLAGFWTHGAPSPSNSNGRRASFSTRLSAISFDAVKMLLLARKTHTFSVTFATTDKGNPDLPAHR